MGLSSLFQRAGDNSTQTSVGTINVYNGITEERAREICKEVYTVIAKDMTQEAIETATVRVGCLNDMLLPKMASYDEKLNAFADPSFQFALRRAQMSAACTNEISDYELLSELLLERAKIKDDKKKQLGIVKALEIVGQISDDALLGLSVMYVATRLKPIADDLHQTLQIYNQIYEKIIGDKKLPTGTEWMDELDILVAVRINSLGIKKSQQYFSEIFSDQLVSGVPRESDAYNRIKKELNLVGLPIDSILIPHPLKPNYVKLITNYDIDNLSLTNEINGEKIITKLNSEQKKILEKVASELRTDESKQVSLQNAFMQEWADYPYLKILREWWDALKYAPTLTQVGRALANAYTRTINPTIPKFD